MALTSAVTEDVPLAGFPPSVTFADTRYEVAGRTYPGVPGEQSPIRSTTLWETVGAVQSAAAENPFPPAVSTLEKAATVRGAARTREANSAATHTDATP